MARSEFIDDPVQVSRQTIMELFMLVDIIWGVFDCVVLTICESVTASNRSTLVPAVTVVISV